LYEFEKNVFGSLVDIGAARVFREIAL